MADLDALYRAAPRPAAVPRGRFRGELLRFIAPPSEPRLLRPLLRVGFDWLPFGVDFTREHWFFVSSAVGLGRFDASIGPSRWRDTQTVRLDYARSRLPAVVRAWLYDEVKPLGETSAETSADTPADRLDDSLCLGIGGIAAPAGRGDLFFFALTRSP